MFILRSFITLIWVAVALSAPQEDLITDLPGLEIPVNFLQYSGYLNGTTGRKLHYWFVESQGVPTTDPLVLWLNGGPGCSSLLGFFQELGPFRVAQDASNTLVTNVYSWNNAANMIFLESPACVGFSYDDSDNCATGDIEVAQMNYLALQEWFGKFPEYRNHDFYITGESYGGVYIPTLSQNIVEGNSTFPINFQGIAIGNGIYNYETNDNTLLFYAYYHSVLGEVEWENLVSTCCVPVIDDPLTCNFVASTDANCILLVNKAFIQIYDTGLNAYNLYDTCPPTLQEFKPNEYNFDLRNIYRPFRTKQAGPEPFAEQTCIADSYTRTYLNTASVRTAIHIPTTVQAWDVCSNAVGSLYQSDYDTTTPVLGFLQTTGIRSLVFNGDVDMVCNFLGNLWEVTTLNLTVAENRRQWIHEGQVAGYVEKFETLDFVTVKGSGHMVPTDKPAEALHMINAFLTNQPY